MNCCCSQWHQRISYLFQSLSCRLCKSSCRTSPASTPALLLALQHHACLPVSPTGLGLSHPPLLPAGLRHKACDNGTWQTNSASVTAVSSVMAPVPTRKWACTTLAALGLKAADEVQLDGLSYVVQSHTPPSSDRGRPRASTYSSAGSSTGCRGASVSPAASPVATISRSDVSSSHSSERDNSSSPRYWAL